MVPVNEAHARAVEEIEAVVSCFHDAMLSSKERMLQICEQFAPAEAYRQIANMCGLHADPECAPYTDLKWWMNAGRENRLDRIVKALEICP